MKKKKNTSQNKFTHSLKRGSVLILAAALLLNTPFSVSDAHVSAAGYTSGTEKRLNKKADASYETGASVNSPEPAETEAPLPEVTAASEAPASETPASETPASETPASETPAQTLTPSYSPVQSEAPSVSPLQSAAPSVSPVQASPSVRTKAASRGSVSSTKSAVTAKPVYSSFTVIHKEKFEKKTAFGIKIKGLKYAGGIKKVTFEVRNEKGKTVFTKKGDESRHNTCFTATVKLKKLGYKLKKYRIRAVITDKNGRKKAIDRQPVADETIKSGKLSVNARNAGAEYTLKKAYIPGNIRKAEFRTFIKRGGKFRHIGTFTASQEKDNVFTYKTEHRQAGKYKVKAFGYTSWGKKKLVNEKKYTLNKNDMGKNGWYYEKYNGRKLKFYYRNNKKVTDVTDELGLRKNGSSRLMLEVNRAAAVVTAYAYNNDTNSYDIPVRAFSVSVGRDTSTNAGAGSLNVNSSFTPLGTFSISSNGSASKYSVKPMHEPNGSVVYARWASHIVGNVYFHSIAVGADSHYALSSYDFNRLGGAASAGCIRMCVYDAKWIYDYASTGSTVKIVYGSAAQPGPLGKPALIKINGISYDPTDPDVPDSRKASDYKAGRTTGYIKHDGTKVGNIAG